MLLHGIWSRKHGKDRDPDQDHCQDDVKQEITIILQCSIRDFSLYLAVDGEPLTVNLTLLADPDQEHCQDDV